MAINLAKGGGAFPSPLGIECGTFSYWCATVLMFASLLSISFGVRDYLIKRTKEKDACGRAAASSEPGESCRVESTRLERGPDARRGPDAGPAGTPTSRATSTGTRRRR